MNEEEKMNTHDTMAHERSTGRMIQGAARSAQTWLLRVLEVRGGGLGRAQLALLVGVHPKTISAWLGDDAPNSIHLRSAVRVALVCYALGFSEVRHALRHERGDALASLIEGVSGSVCALMPGALSRLLEGTPSARLERLSGYAERSGVVTRLRKHGPDEAMFIAFVSVLIAAICCHLHDASQPHTGSPP